MIHIVAQYRQLFLNFVVNSFENKPFSGMSVHDKVNWWVTPEDLQKFLDWTDKPSEKSKIEYSRGDFMNELNEVLKNKEITPNDAENLLYGISRLKQKGEKIRYKKSSVLILREMWVSWSKDWSWMSEKSLIKELQSIVDSKLISRVTPKNPEIKKLDTKRIIEKAEIKKDTKKETKILNEEVISTDVFRRTLRKWSRPGPDIMALQKFLNVKVTSKFDQATVDALKTYQETIYWKWHKYVDGVLSKNGKTLKTIKKSLDYKWSATNVYTREASSVQVKESVNKSMSRMDALQKLNKNSDQFYKALEAYHDGWFRDNIVSDMWSLLWHFREAVWSNEASEYFKKMKWIKEEISQNDDKFNNELNELLKLWLKNNKLADGTEYTARQKTTAKYIARDVVIWAVLWDVPLFDLRLNFAKNLISHGVPMDKALVFKNWVKWWMVDTPDYSQENLDNVSWKDALVSLWKLRSTLTAYGFSAKEIDFTLNGDLEKLTNKQKETLQTIIKNRIIPDLETLNIGWFNFIERWFDNKDNQIENKLKKLTWKKHLLDIKATRKFSNANVEKYDVTLEKVGKFYILEVDDHWSNTNKVFDSMPSESDITNSINEYNKWDKKSYADWWNEPKSISTSTDFLDDEKEMRNFGVFKIWNTWAHIIRSWEKYKYFTQKPSQQDIDNANDNFDNESDNWFANNLDLALNSDLSLSDIFDDIWSIVSLLDEQHKEGWFFGTEEWLEKGLKDVKWKIDYSQWIHGEYKFAKRAMSILEKKNTTLFKRFSMLSVFESSDEFLKAFPTNDEVRTSILMLNSANNDHEYIDILQNINTNPKVREYFDIVLNANKNNAWMKAWKEYRVSNIPKFSGLTRINESSKRKFKYGPKLDISNDLGYSVKEMRKDILSHLKGETTYPEKSSKAMDVLWNILAWIIDKQWFTDITYEDLENSIANNMIPVNIETFRWNSAINTAKTIWNSNHDNSKWIDYLMDTKWDKFVLKSTIDKEITLYTKDWRKVTATKTYTIYLRPECSNLMIMPTWVKLSEKLTTADFNMDVSSLKTYTVPVTLNLLKSALDGLESWEVAWSRTVDDAPIEIPIVPSQPSL